MCDKDIWFVKKDLAKGAAFGSACVFGGMRGIGLPRPCSFRMHKVKDFFTKTNRCSVKIFFTNGKNIFYAQILQGIIDHAKFASSKHTIH